MTNRGMSNPRDADLATYTVHQLLVSGSRFVDDYDEDAAVEHYLKLHPEADPSEVRAELRDVIARLEQP